MIKYIVPFIILIHIFCDRYVKSEVSHMEANVSVNVRMKPELKISYFMQTWVCR